MDIKLTDSAGLEYTLLTSAPSDEDQPHIRKDWTKKSALAFLKEVKITSDTNWIKIWKSLESKLVVANVNAIRNNIASMLAKEELFIREIPPPSKEKKKVESDVPRPSFEDFSDTSSSEEALNKILPLILSNNTPAPAGDARLDDENAVANAQPALVMDITPGVTCYKECARSDFPISMISGEEMLPIEDFAQPGAQAFIWKRFYRTGHSRDVGLGHGWTHTACEYLNLTDDSVELYDDEGRILIFVRPHLRQRSKLINEGMDLDYETEDRFVLKQADQWDKVFVRESESRFHLIQMRHPSYQPENNNHLRFQAEQGYAINLHYDSNNHLERLVSNWGKSLKLIRDEHGRIANVERWNNNTLNCQSIAEYDYDDKGDLIAHRNIAGESEQYEYANHIIIKRTLVTGFNYHYEWDQYDNHGRCVHYWGDDEIYDYRFEWDPDHNTSHGIDSREFKSTFVFNEFGQIVKEIDHEDNVHQYTYKNGRKTSYTDPDGHTSSYFYDQDERPTGHRDPLGNSEKVEYEQGQATTFTDKNGTIWKRQYNEYAQISCITDPLNADTHFEYNERGLLSKVCDIHGHETHYLWNGQRELSEIIDAAGNRQQFFYDDWGHIYEHHVLSIGQDKQEPVITCYEYYDNDQIASVTGPEGDSNRYRYNNDKRLIWHSDPLGQVTEFDYDSISRVVKRTDPNGHTLQYEYDKECNLTALLNQNEERYSFEYDGNQRLIKEIGFDERVQQYKYNNSGQLIQHTDAGEVQTYFERDSQGQIRKKKHRYMIQQDNSEVTDTCHYEYTPTGQVNRSCNNHQYLTFTYNCFGQLEHEHHCDVKPGKDNKYDRISASKMDISYSYNAHGQRTQINLPNNEHIELRYSDDIHHSLVELLFNNKIVSQFKYNHLGQETQRQQGDLTTYSSYDSVGRLTSQKVTNYYNKSNLIYRRYGYDKLNNLISFKDGIDEVGYTYDALNRLTQTEGNSKEQFSFDPAGNLLARDNLQTNQPVPAQNAGNRLIQQGDSKFEYDARGNVSKETRGKYKNIQIAYEYDRQNQLIKVDNDSQFTRYKYDPMGRRIEKKSSFGETKYIWAEDQLVQEIHGKIKKTYLYEPHSFKPVAMVQNNDIYYYHLDHLGTPKEMTNKLGDVVWKVGYKAFGNVAYKEVEEIENNLRFQGQYFDEETGLHYNRHRYYNPNSGQFISQDPIGLSGGINNYQYVPNPVVWIDPFGLTCRQAAHASVNMELSNNNAYAELGPANSGWKPIEDRYNNPDRFIRNNMFNVGWLKTSLLTPHRVNEKKDLVDEEVQAYLNLDITL